MRQHIDQFNKLDPHRALVSNLDPRFGPINFLIRRLQGLLELQARNARAAGSGKIISLKRVQGHCQALQTLQEMPKLKTTK